jgi:predicted ester cyclase
MRVTGGLLNSMPDAFGNEDRRALLNRLAHDGGSAAFLNEQNLVLCRWTGMPAPPTVPLEGCETSQRWRLSPHHDPSYLTGPGIAKKFFEACETGKGWEGCKAYCKPDATFSAQAEPLAGVKNLQQYTDWMKGLLAFIPDGRYELKSFGTDEERKSVCAYGVFSGTHTGQGGPCPPTGKSVKTDYVYVMDFDGEKIRHMTKIWHSGWAMKELGWM